MPVREFNKLTHLSCTAINSYIVSSIPSIIPDSRTAIMTDITPVLSLLSVTRLMSAVSATHTPDPQPREKSDRRNVFFTNVQLYTNYTELFTSHHFNYIFTFLLLPCSLLLFQYNTFDKSSKNKKPPTDAHEIHDAAHTLKTGPDKKHCLGVTGAV